MSENTALKTAEVQTAPSPSSAAETSAAQPVRNKYATSKKHRKMPRWLKIAIAVLFIGALCATVYYFVNKFSSNANSTIEEGMGEGIVVSVGDATEIGKTTRQASEETHIKTPLEEKLERLAKKISAGAFWVAVTMFVVLNLVHWDFAFGRYEFQWTWDMLLQEVQFLMGAVVVVIVAVPEGLPLSVTLALAFSMKTMAKEKDRAAKNFFSDPKIFSEFVNLSLFNGENRIKAENLREIDPVKSTVFT